MHSYLDRITALMLLREHDIVAVEELTNKELTALLSEYYQGEDGEEFIVSDMSSIIVRGNYE